MRRQAILAVVLALVAQAGCKSQGPPKPMDCSVIPPAIDRIMADRASDPRVAAVLPQHKQEMVALCERDQWSAAMGVCIAKAKDRGAMDNCRGLKDEKLEHLKQVNARLRGAIQEVERKQEEAAAAAAGSGSGSAAGGGSGSGAGSGSPRARRRDRPPSP